MRRVLPVAAAPVSGGSVDIRSTPSGYTPKPAAGRTREANADTANRQGVSPQLPSGDARTDRVELSAAALELQAQLEPPANAAGLTPARMQQLSQRMSSGYYDRTEVVDRILARVITSGQAPDPQE